MYCSCHSNIKGVTAVGFTGVYDRPNGLLSKLLVGGHVSAYREGPTQYLAAKAKGADSSLEALQFPPVSQSPD
jgi:hypothetical protein